MKDYILPTDIFLADPSHEAIKHQANIMWQSKWNILCLGIIYNLIKYSYWKWYTINYYVFLFLIHKFLSKYCINNVLFSFQFTFECFCGNSLNLSTTNNGASFDCYNNETTRCLGDKDQWCGGFHGISIYRGIMGSFIAILLVMTSHKLIWDLKHWQQLFICKIDSDWICSIKL